MTPETSDSTSTIRVSSEARVPAATRAFSSGRSPTGLVLTPISCWRAVEMRTRGWVGVSGPASARSVSFIPHEGQLPSVASWTSGCIGQVQYDALGVGAGVDSVEHAPDRRRRHGPIVRSGPPTSGWYVWLLVRASPTCGALPRELTRNAGSSTFNSPFSVSPSSTSWNRTVSETVCDVLEVEV